jgi:hypothetical protein
MMGIMLKLNSDKITSNFIHRDSCRGHIMRGESSEFDDKSKGIYSSIYLYTFVLMVDN